MSSYGVKLSCLLARALYMAYASLLSSPTHISYFCFILLPPHVIHLHSPPCLPSLCTPPVSLVPVVAGTVGGWLALLIIVTGCCVCCYCRRQRGQYTNVYHCIPLYTTVYHCKLLHTTVNHCILLYTTVNYCILLYSTINY